MRRGVGAEIAGDALIVSTLAWSIFAIGGTLPWAVVGLLLMSSVCAAMHAAFGRFRLDAGAALLLGLGVYTGLQVLPFPLGVVAAVDSSTAETWERVFRLLGHVGPASWSMEPDTTRYEAARLLSYGLTWGAVSGHASENGPLRVARWVAWLVAALAGITLLHEAVGAREVYGIYAPRFVSPRWLGPILNPNNLGGLCNLGVFCALACAGGRTERGKVGYVAMAVALACLTVLTGSRGATLALVAGSLLFALGWIRARARVRVRPNGERRPAQLWTAAYAGVSLLTAIALTLDERTLKELTGTSVEKVSLLRWGVEVLREHPWVGVGMGAFGSEVSRVSGVHANMVFPYVECFPLDALTGWGVLVGGCAISAVIWGLWRIGGGFRTHTLRIGLGVVLLQNLMDLGLQVPGVALPTLAVFAACWGGATRQTWSARKRHAVPATLLGAAILGAVLVLPVRPHVGIARAEAAARLQEPDAVERVERLILRYPGDVHLLRTRAALAVQRREGNALAWINAALLRAPNNARTHLLLGQLLASRGQVDQAVVSLRLAAEEREVQPQVVRVMAERAPERLMDVVPDGPMGATLLRLIAGTVERKARAPLLEEAAKRAPSNALVAVEHATEKLHRLAADSVQCAEETPCHKEMTKLIVHAQELGASPAQLRVLRARLRSLGGDLRGAFEELLNGCQRSAAARDCLLLLLEYGERLGPTEYERAARAFIDGVCAKPCTADRMSVAARLLRFGNATAAHQLYVQEASQSGEVRAFVAAAETAARLGRTREAWHWLQKGEQWHRSDAAALESLGAVRTKLGLEGPSRE
jgi:hypothetical protein